MRVGAATRAAILAALATSAFVASAALGAADSGVGVCVNGLGVAPSVTTGSAFVGLSVGPGTNVALATSFSSYKSDCCVAGGQPPSCNPSRLDALGAFLP